MRPGVVLITLALWSGAASEARSEATAFTGFSVERGERFFNATHGGDWSCATCHGSDPRAIGKHEVTDKAIEALAPAANPKRLTDPVKVEKWFRRNCNDVLNRVCTAQERDDVLAFLRSLPPQEVR